MAKLARWKKVTVVALATVAVPFVSVAPARAGTATEGPVRTLAFGVPRNANAAMAAQLGIVIAPVVSGTPMVGSRFATTTGTWSPNSVTISFQWLADGVPLPGAIYSTYYPTAADLGKRLSTAVTAHKAGYVDRTAESGPSGVIQQGKARISGPVYIGGEPKVGATLSGYGGTSTMGPITLSSQWLRDGVEIPGATDETYVPVPADVGAHLRFRLTTSGPGYIPSTATSAATGPVTPS